MHPIRGQVVTATVTATYSEMASVLCLPVLPQAANAVPERCQAAPRALPLILHSQAFNASLNNH